MFNTLTSNHGYDLYYFPTHKFKTTTLRIFVRKSLVGDIEEQAILPFVLKRGSLGFPSLQHISRRLEELYGAALSLDIAKMGETQVFASSMDVVNARFLSDGKLLLKQCCDLLNDILMNPVLEGDAFPCDLFNQEKVNLRRFVESIIDDKASYTYMRLVQEMYRGEPFGNYEWGSLDRIQELESPNVYASYQRLLKTAPIDIYILGQLSREEEDHLPDLLLPLDNREVSPLTEAAPTQPQEDGQVIVEEQALEQSKMAMGFRVNMSCSEEDYYALTLYNAILGRGSFSKLFKTIREEASMAYYISSSFDKLKGFLCISAGIDRENFKQVVDLIYACMDEINQGKISDREFHNAKSSIVNGLKSIADNPGQIIEYNLTARTLGREQDINKVIQHIQDVTKEQVSRVAPLIFKGKTFFLKGKGNGNGSH